MSRERFALFTINKLLYLAWKRGHYNLIDEIKSLVLEHGGNVVTDDRGVPFCVEVTDNE